MVIGVCVLGVCFVDYCYLVEVVGNFYYLMYVFWVVVVVGWCVGLCYVEYVWCVGGEGL